jgi:hypothetical protein
MIDFPFEVVHTPRGPLFRPKAIGIFHGPDNSVSVECLVDSGADTTIIPWQVGQFLGWTVDASDEPCIMGGISGNITCYERLIDIQIGMIRFECTAMWALSDDVPNLLGRQDVFDRFNIEFRQRDKKVIFRPS